MPILETFVAGLVGTLLMTGLMRFVHKTGYANADMIRALGSLATGSMNGALRAGMVVHLVAGLLLAIPYTMLLGILAPHGDGSPVLVGIALGLLHGIIVSLVLIAIVSKRHPVEQFRDAGPTVAAAYIFGHIAYGFGVGLMYGAMTITWS